MLELRLYFAQKSVKVTLSLLLIVGGVAYAFFDWTYLPYFFIISGIVAVVLCFKSLNSRGFYTALFFLYYIPLSMQHEAYKTYYLKITLSDNQNKTYFIVSNTSLKWSDFLLTWFRSEEIQVDFKDKSTFNLKRGLPYNLWFNDKYIYNKGYSHSIFNGKEGNFHYIVLMPLNSKLSDRDKEKLDNEDKENSLAYKGVFGGSYSTLNITDAELNREVRQRKVDSLENSHLF